VDNINPYACPRWGPLDPSSPPGCVPYSEVRNCVGEIPRISAWGILCIRPGEITGKTAIEWGFQIRMEGRKENRLAHPIACLRGDRYLPYVLIDGRHCLWIVIDLFFLLERCKVIAEQQELFTKVEALPCVFIVSLFLHQFWRFIPHLPK
jgi:hypothetical protein